MSYIYEIATTFCSYLSCFSEVTPPDDLYNVIISDPNLDTYVSLDPTESSINERPYIGVKIKGNENGGRTITEIDPMRECGLA